MIKDLDEAIKHAEEVADNKCDKCGQEHRQLAEWLKELKAYKEQEPCDIMSIDSMVQTIATKVTEDTEKFIFETIKPYCEEITKREISKKDLEQALTQYFSKEPCDTISREAVIDILQYAWESKMYIPECIREVKDLPPVETSRRKGHWLHKEITDDYRVTGQCSECKERRIIDNFCPNCGADMRGAE